MSRFTLREHDGFLLADHSATLRPMPGRSPIVLIAQQDVMRSFAENCRALASATCRHCVMAAVGCMAIRSDRVVQGNAITGLRTRPRPIAELLYPGLSSRRADARVTSDMSGGRWRSRLNVR